VCSAARKQGSPTIQNPPRKLSIPVTLYPLRPAS
jgi:hypothetical protein